MLLWSEFFSLLNVCINVHAGSGFLHPDQRHIWSHNWFFSLHMCTLSLTVAASALMGSSAEATGSGIGSWYGLGVVVEHTGKLARIFDSFQSAAYTLWLGVIKSVCELLNSRVLFSIIYPPTRMDRSTRQKINRDNGLKWHIRLVGHSIQNHQNTYYFQAHGTVS